ncbi:hypothetical protein Tco_0969819 [Tanacetum coccineum]
MFCDTLKLPVETLENPFITPVTIKTIESFMQTVGYQGIVDKVSAFNTKFLAQPWQTMLKVFNRFLTTRTSGHDQTKINILYLFHVMVNHTNVNYTALLWWDLMNNVFQKKNVIQYPRFIKLIIADLMEKYPSIPRRHDKDYHSIKDDNLLVSFYSIGNVLFRGMQIPDAFLTAKIRATDDYKEYETAFVGVDVPMNQSQPVVSTQGTHRSIPRSYRTPTLTIARPQGKKRKQCAGETSSPRKPLKVTIRQKKQSTTPIPPPGDDRERDEVDEATILSLTLHKTALAAEAQENIAKVHKKLDEVEKMVEGDEDEESYASEFANSMINDDVDDSGTRIEPESHKEHPKNVNDDDEEIEKEMKDGEIEKEETNDDVEKTGEVDKEKDNDAGESGSMEFRNEKKKTPIPTPTRSPKTYLSSNKTISEELTTTVSPTTATTSKDSSISKCKKSKIREVLDHCNNVVPELTFTNTNEMINKEMPRLVNLAVNKDRENTTLNLYPTTSSSTVGKSTADLQQQLYLIMKSKPQDQAANPKLWEILNAKFENQ